MTTKRRRLSGVRATGRLHLGNYLGALRQWVEQQEDADNFFFIADLHGLTDAASEHDPVAFKHARLSTAAMYLAVGIDPSVSTLFFQSDVPEHTDLMWFLSSVAKKGELERMTQWKDKKGKGGGASSALFFYPVLMAADILLYDADEVPVGDDQRQHVEMARDWAIRFNHHFGNAFIVPSAVIPPAGARVMDLQRPNEKMSKSAKGEGTIYLDDSDDEVVRKIKRAVTDSAGVVASDPERPGISNLVELYATIENSTTEEVTNKYEGQGYGVFKQDLADRMVELVRPIRDRVEGLRDDPHELHRQLSLGADRAQSVAHATAARAAEALGLGPIV
jgi:tryptophanyl-tRNA synthetase